MIGARAPVVYFRGFNGLRAVAIVGVMTIHVIGVTGFPPAALGWFGRVALAGWAGVDLFFALSGFLITALLLQEEDRAGPIAVGAFYLRRAIRILPVFAFVFLLETLLISRSDLFRSVLVGRPGFTTSIVPFAAFFGNYSMIGMAQDPGPALGCLWSLCVEEHFYLAWPLFLVLVRGRNARITATAAACCAMLLIRSVCLALGWASLSAAYLLSHFRVDSILWGALGALVVHRWHVGRWVRRPLLVVCGGIVVALIASGNLEVGAHATAVGHSIGFACLAIAATILLIELFHDPRSSLARALEWGPLDAIGRVSYGMYLIHFPILDLTGAAFDPWLHGHTIAAFLTCLAVAVALAFGAARIMFRYIEAPALQLRRQLTHERKSHGKSASPARTLG